MRVCVVGSGGREHALAACLAKDSEVIVAPGNAGMEFESYVGDPIDVDADLYVIGPEQPLVDGLADRLRERSKLVFGPGAKGAQLEGSKAWMKGLLNEAGVPTARYVKTSDKKVAIDFLKGLSPPYVIKTDGLAAGKGVAITETLADATKSIDLYLSGEAFGDAGKVLIVEEGLSGPEISVFAICDGQRSVILSPAQDHKRLHSGDKGPNTGGMGAYTPVPLMSQDLLNEIQACCIEPTLKELQKRDIDYRGVLFAGLMLCADGPRILEYNVRFGDPETQVVVPLIESNLVDLLASAAEGNLAGVNTRVSSDAIVSVVCAAPGYPLSPRTGDVIHGLKSAQTMPGVSIYCAGVTASESGDLLTAGGRVLNVCGRGDNLERARQRAYGALENIYFDGMQYRSDIALATGPK